MSKRTRDKLLAAAEAEMLDKGYPGTTVDEICDRAGVSKGSFYHFFPTKEDLGLAVLEAFHVRNSQVAQGAPEGRTPRETAVALLDHLVEEAATMWGGGCLLGSFALDLAKTHPQIASEVSARFRATAEMLAGGLAPLAKGEDRARAAEELAERFVVTVEGSLVLARAHGDWGYVERALGRFRDEVLSTGG